MRLVKCAKNHFYDADRHCNCPLCNQSFEKSYGRSPYIWNSSTMDIKDLKSFEISFGNYPIICISYDGEKLTVHNRSGTTYNEFPAGFYDDKIVELSDVQKATIINYINAIDFSTWKTNENARKNYEMGACGFCIHNSFTITFNNGELFKCYEPKCEQFKLLADFLRKFCDSSWFEISFDKRADVEYETILSKNKYASDADYVCLPSNMTRMLFDNTLKLYNVDTGLNIEFCNEKIDVGRDPNCELNIDDNYVSRMHASFYHEDSSWFISDKGSRNGTWLNNKKLAKNTKYELCPGDVISFAKIREYVFYKPKEDKARKHNES